MGGVAGSALDVESGRDFVSMGEDAERVGKNWSVHASAAASIHASLLCIFGTECCRR